MPVPLSNAFIPGAQQPTPVPATVDEVYQGDGALQVSNHPSYPGFSVVVCMDYFDNTKPAVICVIPRAQQVASSRGLRRLEPQVET